MPPQANNLPPPAPVTPVDPGAPPNPNDPINVVDVQYLRNEAGSVMGELIAALPQQNQQLVKNIPFVADPTPGNVNAFAACDDAGQPLMAITDGLLEIEANISNFKATDEIFGTHKLIDYEQMIASQSRPGQALPKSPAGFVDPTQNADARKVARQHVLMDEQLAFVLGHELSHHYLGHTGCANGGGSKSASPADLARAATRVLPTLNQGNEAAADWAGTNNALTAGARRQGAHWTEEGAILTLDFFGVLDTPTPTSVAASFINSHPHPLLRKVGVQAAANTWRATGGQGIQVPSLPQIFGR